MSLLVLTAIFSDQLLRKYRLLSERSPAHLGLVGENHQPTRMQLKMSEHVNIGFFFRDFHTISLYLLVFIVNFILTEFTYHQ